jgi:hypothetical protein
VRHRELRPAQALPQLGGALQGDKGVPSRFRSPSCGGWYATAQSVEH